jgi:hypothetical protein
MEDILTYVIVFGLIIGGFAFWQFRYAKPRPYLLSKQIYPELDLNLLIEKTEGKTKEFVVQINLKKPIFIEFPVVELIDKNRQSLILELDQLLKCQTNSNDKDFNKNTIYKCPFEEFNKALTNSEFKYKTFRLVLKTESDKKFKSHELAFNKTWTIYRPDSGKYN